MTRVQAELDETKIILVRLAVSAPSLLRSAPSPGALRHRHYFLLAAQHYGVAAGARGEAG